MEINRCLLWCWNCLLKYFLVLEAKNNKKKTTQETKMKTFHLELKENLKS